MLILLPPSEGKTQPRRGRPIDLERLSLPELNPGRERVLTALMTLCTDADRARAVLGLSPGQAEDVTHNTRLRVAATATAGSVYTGVLYEALDLATLTPPARRVAARSLLVFSGLWGAVRIGDRIPAYRCPVGVSLPGLGGLAGHWRTAMAEPLTTLAGRGLVLDLRSSAYAGMWKPRPPAVTVRVLQERDGQRSVVSHFNKATKGRIVRSLLESGARPRTPAQLCGTLTELGYRVEAPTPGAIDVIVSEI